MPQFAPGKSGNPRGRPTEHAKAAKIRQQILKAAPDVVTALIVAAQSGDSGAARTLLACACPPLKAVELPIALNLPDEGLADQGRAVVAALSAGQLAPGQASQILSALGALARIVELGDIERRLSAVEARQPDWTALVKPDTQQTLQNVRNQFYLAYGLTDPDTKDSPE